MLHVATVANEPAVSKLFQILNCNFSIATRYLKKKLVLATGVPPPPPHPFIFSRDGDEKNRVKILNGADSTLALLYYKSKVNRAEKMYRNKKIQST